MGKTQDRRAAAKKKYQVVLEALRAVIAEQPTGWTEVEVPRDDLIARLGDSVTLFGRRPIHSIPAIVRSRSAGFAEDLDVGITYEPSGHEVEARFILHPRTRVITDTENHAFLLRRTVGAHEVLGYVEHGVVYEVEYNVRGEMLVFDDDCQVENIREQYLDGTKWGKHTLELVEGHDAVDRVTSGANHLNQRPQQCDVCLAYVPFETDVSECGHIFWLEGYGYSGAGDVETCFPTRTQILADSELELFVEHLPRLARVLCLHMRTSRTIRAPHVIDEDDLHFFERVNSWGGMGEIVGMDQEHWEQASKSLVDASPTDRLTLVYVLYTLASAGDGNSPRLAVRLVDDLLRLQPEWANDVVSDLGGHAVERLERDRVQSDQPLHISLRADHVTRSNPDEFLATRCVKFFCSFVGEVDDQDRETRAQIIRQLVVGAQIRLEHMVQIHTRLEAFDMFATHDDIYAFAEQVSDQRYITFHTPSWLKSLFKFKKTPDGVMFKHLATVTDMTIWETVIGPLMKPRAHDARDVVRVAQYVLDAMLLAGLANRTMVFDQVTDDVRRTFLAHLNASSIEVAS